MKSSRSRSDAPSGARRVVRTAIELTGLARKVVPAYARGNAQVEGFVKVARDTRDGALLAPELSKDPVARLGLSAFEPLARALGVGFDVGELLSGTVASDTTELGFEALDSSGQGRPKAKAKSGRQDRGGILAVLAVDEDGAPIERSGEAQPDARTAAEIARAVDRLRRELQSARFQVELTFARGGAFVRAVPRATVVVVVEPGVDLRRVSSLVPDPASYQRTESTPDAATGTQGARANGHSGGSAANVDSATPQASSFTNGESGRHQANGASSRAASAFAASGERGAAAKAPQISPRFSPPHAHARDAKRKSGLLGSVLTGLGQRTAKRFFGPDHESASKTAAPRPTAAAPRAATATPALRIVRAEVEDTGTRLLRAAEDYLGPRTLDRLIKEVSPRTFAWQNRRVVVGGEERVAVDAANGVYREIRDLFGRGAAVSDALRRFDYDAWLAAQQLAAQHAGIARAALTGGGSA